jgi:hypothetical protein
MAEFKQSGRNYIVDIEIKVMLTIEKGEQDVF